MSSASSGLACKGWALDMLPLKGARPLTTTTSPRLPSAAVRLHQLPDRQAMLQQVFTSERIEALLEDRRIREQEAAAATLALSQQLEASLARLGRAEENLRTATRDYILGAAPDVPLACLGCG